ncbi:MAG TPA: FixH family protein [Polyangiaceae bacterium]|nr:FixH family protein [Polyangiaceae bacterium]
MKKTQLTTFTVPLALLVLACSSPGPTTNPVDAATIDDSDCGSAMSDAASDAAPGPSFPNDPLTTVTSDGGKLRLTAWTSPAQPPSRGMITVKLLATDASSNAPVDGLVLDIVPVMPSMGHGTPVKPTVMAAGGGVYVASNVDLFMAGLWDLNVSISGAVTDTAVVPIDVQ